MRWEYCKIRWFTGEGSSETVPDSLKSKIVENASNEDVSLIAFGVILFPNEEPRDISDLMIALADLGKEGWEMVSHSIFVDPGRRNWSEIAEIYLKRQVS